MCSSAFHDSRSPAKPAEPPLFGLRSPCARFRLRWHEETSRPGILLTNQYPAVSPGVSDTGRSLPGKQDRPGKPYWLSSLPVKDSHNVRSGIQETVAGSSSQIPISRVTVAGISSGITSTPGFPLAVLLFIHAFCAACATHTRITCMSSNLAMHCASRGGCAIRRIFVITRCLNSRCIVIRTGCKILYIYFVVERSLNIKILHQRVGGGIIAGSGSRIIRCGAHKTSEVKLYRWL